LPEQLLERLRRVAERRSTSQTALVERYIEEGLRMEAHPMIVFRDGALGRRAMLAGTRLEVMHVIDTVRNSETLEDAAEYLSLGIAHVTACLQYYAEYQDELDAYAARLTEENERLRERWEREQALLAR
jgi:uncharacterized protein (DUF433 family)